MAKRRRLGPAAITGQGLSGPDPSGQEANEPALTGGSGPVSTPPIAQVAGAAASEVAARELADELSRARAEGRMVQDIALDDIDETHLTRDRVAVAPGDMAALEASIRARGQQMPVEVVDLGPEAQPRYGLISGWRRLAALKRLREGASKAAGGDASFATARAVLRRPDGAAEAYLSMVEENELRVGLSYYERAQVAARAADLGVFDSSEAAVAALFSTASKAKRSKINAFIRVFRVLDPVLRFPEAIPERLGLRLAKALDAGQGARIYAALAEAEMADAAAEQARIDRIIAGKTGSKPPSGAAFASFPGDVELTRGRGGLKLSGAGVDEALTRDLTQWLADRQAGRG